MSSDVLRNTTCNVSCIFIEKFQATWWGYLAISLRHIILYDNDVTCCNVHLFSIIFENFGLGNFCVNSEKNNCVLNKTSLPYCPVNFHVYNSYDIRHNMMQSLIRPRYAEKCPATQHVMVRVAGNIP